MAQPVQTAGDENTNRIQTAIQFLSHPKTVNASLWEKISFLQRKGLTPHQIYHAVHAVDPVAAQHPQLHLILFGNAQKSWTLIRVLKWLTGVGSIVATLAGLGILIYRWRESHKEDEVKEVDLEEEAKVKVKEIDPESKQTIEDLSELNTDLGDLNRTLRAYNTETSSILRQLATLNQKREKLRAKQQAVDVKSGTYKKAEISSSIMALFNSKKSTSSNNGETV
jgi:hypothetical protein